MIMDSAKNVSQNSKFRSFLNDFLLTPIQSEIDSGKLDRSMMLALLRVTSPLIVLVFVLIVVSAIQIGLSVKLMHVISVNNLGK